MATAAVLSLLDEHTRRAAFDASLAKLKAAPHGIDIDALDICIRLLTTSGIDGDAGSISQHDQLWDIVLARLVDESSSDRFYEIAGLCLSHGAIIAARLKTALYTTLSRSAQAIPIDDLEIIQSTNSYLSFLKCCFWVPAAREHMVDAESLSLVSTFIGIDGLDEVAHDTLSAYFSLLKNERGNSPAKLGRKVNQSLWTRLDSLDAKRFAARSSNIYRTWFQWISLAASSSLELECIKDEQYWKRLRIGLVKGHADQRKYCLGIIRQSLLTTTDRIDTPSIQYAGKVDRENYDLYSTLFETIVLHRYTGQVEDSLSSMTKLLGSSKALPSKIASAMTTTLLTAALDPLIQESIRKMIGHWYMDFVIQSRGDISGHIHFLFDGFLPWATDGSLFTSTLSATRIKTTCAHGEALAAVIARFASETADQPSFVPSVDYNIQEIDVDNRRGRAIILGITRFIMNARGRLFQPAMMYLLQGLIQGLTARYNKSSVQYKFPSSDLAEILSLARLTGLPEVASDLHSIHCRKLCDLVEPDLASENVPTDESLRVRCKKLEEQVDQSASAAISAPDGSQTPSLQQFLDDLRKSKHSCIQGPAFAPACKTLCNLLDQMEVGSVNPEDLHTALSALWEEAEIRDFIRPFAVHLPPLIFHPTCIGVCVAHHQEDIETPAIDLKNLLAKAMSRLTRLSKGRSYVLASLAKSLREAAFSNPPIMAILPFEEYILDLVNDPAFIRSEFLFEVVAAQNLQQYLPHRTYTSYYGLREWHAYTAVIDLLRRFPEGQLDVARSILNRLLQPWKDQQPPVAVKSPWKRTLQLQAMLLLSHYCIKEKDADAYLDGLTHALALESWPRYRYLLEWTLARIYRNFPGKSSRIIEQLQDLDEYSPIHIASLIKLGLLVAPYETEDFASKLMMQLNAYSASPKVQIRHEANFAFPLVFDLANVKGWRNILENPALIAMNAFIRRLDKFSASPWTIRTLKVDIEQDFTMSGIFQGRYLSIESPEDELVTGEDFEILQLDDQATRVIPPPASIQLGTAPSREATIVKPAPAPVPVTPSQDATNQITLQTKAGIDLDNLHPASGPPSVQNQRPASVMLIASLIDNPTNLGGLSRISESFGLEALYIDDLKKVAHKDFKATSVRSEKHLAIKELKEVGVPAFLLDAKSKGYEVVGIEQTDRSGILGQGDVDVAMVEGDGGLEEAVVRQQDIGTLPKKCCLVLGSEKEGISAEVLAVIDRNVEIKTVGVTRSLNVQTAGGIALYEWWREWGR
ncbi:trna rrna methyltransferase [Stemphylium lycopersici]|nr:trna rrna methyltransferase [Stemphylium lycopersici]